MIPPSAATVGTMAPRSNPRFCIVPATNTMTPEEIRQEEWNLPTLSAAINGDPSNTLIWLARRCLIKNRHRCDKCGDASRFQARRRAVDRFVWYCNRCKCTKTVRSASVFERSRLALSKILLFMYAWSANFLQRQAASEATISYGRCSVGWAKRFRSMCTRHFDSNPIKVGGQGKLVEVDETCFTKRKYNRGRPVRRRQTWVFGGMERDGHRRFATVVADRKASTLAGEIRRYVRPGTHIISDGLPAYANIVNMPDCFYGHSVVIHKQGFLNPTNTSVHTQNIESLWSSLKRKHKFMCGSTGSLQTYIDEFLWRKESYDGAHLFGKLILTLRQQYPFAVDTTTEVTFAETEITTPRLAEVEDRLSTEPAATTDEEAASTALTAPSHRPEPIAPSRVRLRLPVASRLDQAASGASTSGVSTSDA